MPEQFQPKQELSSTYFTPVQRSYYKKLIAELEDVARGRTPKAMAAQGDIKSLDEVIRINNLMTKFLETEEVPKVVECEINVGGFEKIHKVLDVNGRVSLVVRKNDKDFVIDYKGKKISEEFDELEDSGVDEMGNIILDVLEDNKHHLIYNGQKLGEGYQALREPISVGGKIMFPAKMANKWFIVDENGKIKSEGYDEIKDLQPSGDSFIYCTAEKTGAYSNKCSIIKENVSNGQREIVGDDYQHADAEKIGDEVFFEVRKNNKCFIINEKGERISKDYDRIYSYSMKDIAGKLAFIAGNYDEDDCDHYIVEDGKEKFVGKHSQSLWLREFKIIGGKKFFSLGDNSNSNMVIYDDQGNKIGKEVFDFYIRMIDVGGKLYISEYHHQTRTHCLYDAQGERVGAEYDDIQSPMDINGKLAYFAKKGGQWFVVNENGQKVSADYDEIDTLGFRLGMPYIIAQYNDKIVLKTLNPKDFE